MFYFLFPSVECRASLIAQLVKNLPATQETLQWMETSTGEGIGYPLQFSWASAGKESACNVEDVGLIPELGRSPGEGGSYPLQNSGLENSLDSQWGQKDSDMTEGLSLPSFSGM